MVEFLRCPRLFAALFLALPLALTGCPFPEIPAKNAKVFEDDIFEHINNRRTDHGRTPMVRDATVDAVAVAHSQDMMNRRFVAHTNPDGDGPGERLDDAEIPWVIAGENVVRIQGRRNNEPVQEVVDGWMRSAGHRANILDTDWTHTGIGVAIDHNLVYITQLFINYGEEAPLEKADFVYVSGPLELD